MASSPVTASEIKARLSSEGSFGLGASTFGNLYKAIPQASVDETMDAAWEVGVRYYDTAPFYGFGLSERRTGDALRERPTGDYILSTKVGRMLRPIPEASERFGFASPMPFEPVFDYSYDAVMRSFEDSLQRLGLSRIDILYMHDIGTYTHGEDNARLFPIAMDGGYRALDELRSQGLVGAIGLGVNEMEVCEASFAHADFDLFMLAGRYSLLNQHPLDGFFDECIRRNVGIVAAGVFNSGILATGVRSGAVPHYDYDVAPPEIIERTRRIEEICERHGVPLPAAALRFSAAHPAVLIAIIGTSSGRRIRETAAFMDWPIPADLWSQLRDEGLIRHEAPTPA